MASAWADRLAYEPAAPQGSGPMTETMNTDLCRALQTLVSDWQANGNSRPLGDPAADVWQAAAAQAPRRDRSTRPTAHRPGRRRGSSGPRSLVILTQFGSAGLVARKARHPAQPRGRACSTTSRAPASSARARAPGPAPSWCCPTTSTTRSPP
ncbi:hypothetical protein G5V59_00345 [Nocardioides sp. W3-2-3]|uniref:hypothetical protein n=1 Tax=Nocardioides convexus TaxID=2712224 RepID=UPI002418392F|nr:hypothetical protein [Nocardioides convexus]NGZ99420.1 hypothetical protein [Nocardioides convexus]